MMYVGEVTDLPFPRLLGLNNSKRNLVHVASDGYCFQIRPRWGVSSRNRESPVPQFSLEVRL